MKILLLGPTGMIGQGVLHECLLAPDVDSVLTLTRNPTGQTHSKLREIHYPDLETLAPIEPELANLDACFFCVGVSAAGLGETAYRRITYDLTLAVASTLARLNPAMIFIYVSGAGTDPLSRQMWARVKGETELALLALPFRACMFRPAAILPRRGIRSKTRLYRALYAVLGPLLALLRPLAPNYITATDTLGRAMLHVARHGLPAAILDTSAINSIG
jgi:uncharacterized protein YbjT (DUF2867 family)